MTIENDPEYHEIFVTETIIELKSFWMNSLLCIPNSVIVCSNYAIGDGAKTKQEI